MRMRDENDVEHAEDVEDVEDVEDDDEDWQWRRFFLPGNATKIWAKAKAKASL